MKTMLLRLLGCALFIYLLGDSQPTTVVHAQESAPFRFGDIFVTTTSSTILHYDSNGRLLETIAVDTAISGPELTGCYMKPDGKLLVATGSSGGLIQISGAAGPHTTLGSFGSGFSGSPQTLAFAANGYFYLGATNGDNDIRKYDPRGNLVTTYDVQTENAGITAIVLSEDQSTITYSAGGNRIFRYDVKQAKQLTDLVSTLPGSRASDLGIQGYATVVADQEFIFELDSKGKEHQRFDEVGQNAWSQIAFDPNISHITEAGYYFWAADSATGKLFKFLLYQSGTPTQMIDTGLRDHQIVGMCIMGEPNPADVDSDRDGFPNYLEDHGYDWNEDGIVDVDLPALGALPYYRDIFVHIDWFEINSLYTFKPSQDAINKVVQAFANAPVFNPNESSGINLHVELGQPIFERNDYVELGKAGKQRCTYDWTEFDTIRTAYLSIPKQYIYRYAIFADVLPVIDCMNDRPSGVAREMPSSDFIVALGGQWKRLFKPEQYAQEQAGTFMHELGHTLGLGHGGIVLDDADRLVGPESTTNKPNHLSVMNYLFQYGLIHRENNQLKQGLLDYSRFDSNILPSLNENMLNEANPLAILPDVKDYGSGYYCPDNTFKAIDDLYRSVDWNCQGSIESLLVKSNISNDVDPDTNSPIFSNLSTEEEWSHLLYVGGAVGGFGTALNASPITSLTEMKELTFAQFLSTNPPVSIAFNSYVPVVIR